MKPKYLVMTLGTVLAAGGLWLGHTAWRAHLQLVTLDVREVPLTDVLRMIERQTWTKIRAEKSVDARITLRVKDALLRSVLDRIAQQAGARWSTVYAVYDSSHALKALDSTLRGDGKLEPVGWTKVAPKFPSPDQLDKGMDKSTPRADLSTDSPSLIDEKPEIIEGSKGSGPSVFWQGGKPPPPDASEAAGGQRRTVFRVQPEGPVMLQGGPDGQIELWSPEELLVEGSLNARIGSDGATRDLAATADSAARTARAVNGKWTTYLAFHKWNLRIGFAGPPPGPPGFGPGRPMPRLNPNERFANLTPAQRVQQARQHLPER